MRAVSDRLIGRLFIVAGLLQIGLAVLGLALLPGSAATVSFLIVLGILVLAMGYGVVRQASFRFWRLWHFVGFPAGVLVTGAVVYLYPPDTTGARFGLEVGSVVAIVFWILTLGRVRRSHDGDKRVSNGGTGVTEGAEGEPEGAESEKPQMPNWVLPLGVTLVGALTIYEYVAGLAEPWDYWASVVAIFVGLVAGTYAASLWKERPVLAWLMIFLLVIGATVGVWQGLNALRAFSTPALFVVIVVRVIAIFRRRGKGR